MFARGRPRLPDRGALAILAVAALELPAHAHQTSVKYVDVTVRGRTAAIQLTVAPGDVTEPLGLAPDARPSVAEALVPRVAAYVAGWVAVSAGDGPPCPAGAPAAHADADARFVVVAWEVACGDDAPL